MIVRQLPVHRWLLGPIFSANKSHLRTGTWSCKLPLCLWTLRFAYPKNIDQLSGFMWCGAGVTSGSANASTGIVCRNWYLRSVCFTDFTVHNSKGSSVYKWLLWTSWVLCMHFLSSCLIGLGISTVISIWEETHQSQRKQHGHYHSTSLVFVFILKCA